MAATIPSKLGTVTVRRAKDTALAGEYQCVSCGYGIVIHSSLPACPMCRGEEWARSRWNPVSRDFELGSEPGFPFD
jgi:hypothetical protein